MIAQKAAGAPSAAAVVIASFLISLYLLGLLDSYIK
jgi:hypothetical protein